MKAEFQDKKAAALKATLELIAEQGFHATPMSQIAQKANIGVGTIYRYFTCKEDLINILYIDIKTHLTRYIFRNRSENMPVQEGFKQFLSNTIHYFIENPAELSFTEQYENSPLITTATREESSRISEPAVDLFKQALEQNLLKKLPLEILGALISGATIALIKLYLSGKVKADDTSFAASIDAIWEMIKK